MVFLEKKYFNVNTSLCYDFLTKSMMPVGHISVVQRERSVVLYALKTRMPINVRKLIFFQLTLSIHNSNLVLYFPSIITKLCARAEVVFHDDDEWLQAIDDA